MQVKAFAKINLGLKILDKRPDGFHNLETVFAKLGLHDSLEFTKRDDDKIIITVDGAVIPRRENLVFRAAWLLQKFSPRRKGVNIFLKKRIPLQSGLGGGSSDAAATLKALVKFWKLNVSKDRLERLALHLGSDVPFFLSTGLQLAQGRGELLQKVELPKNFPREVVLVFPGMGISTKWAFKKMQNVKFKMKNKSFTRGGKVLIKNLENDFEKLVFREFPELKKIKTALKRSGASFSSLSGSGSAIYGLFQKKAEAEQARKKLENVADVFLTKIK